MESAWGRWPAIVLAIVLVDVVCFYAFSLFAMDTTHFVWMSVNAGALVFGPVIWMEHRRLHRKGATLRERQSEKQREQERQKLEELQRKAQEAERQRLAELRREAERQREQVEEEREAERRCHQDHERGAAVQSRQNGGEFLKSHRAQPRRKSSTTTDGKYSNAILIGWQDLPRSSSS